MLHLDNKEQHIDNLALKQKNKEISNHSLILRNMCNVPTLKKRKSKVIDWNE